MSSNANICQICSAPLMEDGFCPECTISHTHLMKIEAQPQTPHVDAKVAVGGGTLIELVSQREFAVAYPLCAIGRAPGNQIVIRKDPSVSRFHCLITATGGNFYIQDLESRNGTFVNASRVRSKSLLNDGDSVRVGRVRFRFMSGVTENSAPGPGGIQEAAERR